MIIKNKNKIVFSVTSTQSSSSSTKKISGRILRARLTETAAAAAMQMAAALPPRSDSCSDK